MVFIGVFYFVYKVINKVCASHIMQWSPQQDKALQEVNNWFKSKNRKQVFRVFGYAGTGKTTLAKHFAESVDGTVLYAAFTGKAALMMRKNGCFGASTIHSLIYTPVVDKIGNVKFELNKNSPLKMAELLIVDECSMVDEKIGKDLLSFRKPILVLGDPAQLPPVSGAGFFTEAKPDIMLTEIHRQAKDNPILYLATLVRQGGRIVPGSYGDSVVTKEINSEMLTSHDQTILGKNSTRQLINNKFRKILGFDNEFPVAGDKLVCLKNDKDLGIYNGGMFNVVSEWKFKKSKVYKFYTLQDQDAQEGEVVVKIHNTFFSGGKRPEWKQLSGSQQFDYGYGITAHKSQGSQWEKVLVIDESGCFREDAKRWLYTAITRAEKSVTVSL